MSSGNTGIKGCDDLINVAESSRQSGITATTAQSTVISTEIAFHRAVVKAALKNGVSPAASMSALKELGVTGQ